jgi:hypothetical protein
MRWLYAIVAIAPFATVECAIAIMSHRPRTPRIVADIRTLI